MAIAGCLSLALAGCAISQITSPFRSESKQDAWAPSVSEESLLEAARSDTSGRVDMASVVGSCPTFKVWQRDKMLTVYEIGQVGDSSAVRHRGEITKTARECQVTADKVIVKYGFAGRVLLGPRGQAGTITLPLQVHVTDRTRNMLTSQKVNVVVSMTPDSPVGYFSAVQEIPIMLPIGARPADYSVYVAFDRSAPGAG